MIPLLLLLVIPGVNLFAPLAWALFGAWMLAIEYADYPMGNHDYYFAQEKALLAKHRPLALGFGGVLLVMTLVPVLNFLAMPVGVAGATALWVERLAEAE
jgi:CysZ protein